ncbi:MAG: hypothetical protein ACREAC_08375, partial [Blastocatellia bacterium]
LQGLILSDIKQSVFRRAKAASRFLWFFDEAQNLYHSPANRSHMVDLMTMARSFGSYFVLLTQSLTSAVHDQDILNSILANVRWIIMLRSTLRDAQVLAPALPLSGRVPKHKHNPYEETKYLTESEELRARLNEITKLPDRTAYLWLKASLRTSVKMSTESVPSPHELAGVRPEEFETFMHSIPLGHGIPRAEIIRANKERERKLLGQSASVDSEGPPGPEKSAKGRAGKTAGKLAKMLEEEYAKKSEVKKRKR